MLPISQLLTPISPRSPLSTEKPPNLPRQVQIRPAPEARIAFPAPSRGQEQPVRLPSYEELLASVKSMLTKPPHDQQTTESFSQDAPGSKRARREDAAPPLLTTVLPIHLLRRPIPTYPGSVCTAFPDSHTFDTRQEVQHSAPSRLPRGAVFANASVAAITERRSGGVIATAMRRITDDMPLMQYRSKLKDLLDAQKHPLVGLDLKHATWWLSLNSFCEITSTTAKAQLCALDLTGLQLSKISDPNFNLRSMPKLQYLNLARLRCKLSNAVLKQHAMLLKQLLRTFCTRNHTTTSLQKLGLSGTHFCGANLIAEIVNVVSPQKFVRLTLLDLSGIFFNGQEVSADELSEVSAALRLPERWGPGLSVVISNEASRQIDWMNS